MRLTIAARKSDLARLQAYMVGNVIKENHPDMELKYRFRSSLGDQNQHDPLWEMPSQGVFTQDFRADLVEGRVDMVVHSWKDLPTQNDGSTLLAATLPRADHRDLLLVKKGAVKSINDRRTIRLLSSSPRRMYNLQGFLKRAFPGGLDKVDFQSVRGNIQTRFDKMLNSDADGLIVAKAAIDRLGTASLYNQPHDNFDESTATLCAVLDKCQWMVLPASYNPPAAAQGALVVEIARERKDLAELLDRVNCHQTYEDVAQEREILAAYGGGCHQKIGVWVHTRKEGKVLSLQGKTDAGETLDQFTLQPVQKIPFKNKSGKIAVSEIFHPSQCAKLFSRTEIPVTSRALEKIARADALLLATSRVPDAYLDAIKTQIVWASGVTSWFKLAKKGIWVHGVDDNLGANSDRQLEFLLGPAPVWLTLTHSASPVEDRLSTYDLVAKAKFLKVKGAQYFYWRSGSAFKRAIELEPAIKEGVHACGLGQTYKIITQILEAEISGPKAKVYSYLHEEDWLAQISS